MTPLNFEEFDHCFKKELVSSEESRGIVKVQKVGRPAISKNKFAQSDFISTPKFAQIQGKSIGSETV